MTKLPIETIVTHITKITGWTHVGNHAIIKNFSFPSFEKTGQFVYLVTKIMDQEKHYPQISITDFNVQISLTTYDVEGVTGKDLVMAQKINRIENQMSEKSINYKVIQTS
ncbi:4a-hydroxytetrahydrobiopterin dehydratase [Alkalihalobacterium alkalinitrilicum]|uniref:4a-hydroxytetrahydrobiopterin dehydratase n=1 Tax=Alkalihalobacterium alkalinitrilicum TaxID=427920 RepID=UPI0009951454|nr:4a-hydroxytetrahydrobiopterin dehydratase [Alkalihalobacterium alkalinitrilicum]